MTNSSGLRRALARAASGKTLDQREVEILLACTGVELEELLAVSSAIHDQVLQASAVDAPITYSPKVFIPLTRTCRDRCHYCTFVRTPAQLAAQGESMYLSPEQVQEIAQKGAAAGCFEALFTLGDRPEERWPEAADWLESRGFSSTLDYVRAMSILVLEETGLLPHLNPGVMSWDEMARLKPVSASMGLMLETTSMRLFTERGQAHFGSPDKDPTVRIRMIEDAGRLSIPFTTGLLIGIGETISELAESILTLRGLSRTYGHIQEVIIQNFRAKPSTPMQSHPDADQGAYLAAIAVTRIVMGASVKVQAPPNLSNRGDLGDLLRAGVDDWGGVSPVTSDHVNPERPWPEIETLREVTEDSGLQLRPRLAAHPRYVLNSTPWIDPRVQPYLRALADPTTGLARRGAMPRGIPWQEPSASEEYGNVNLDAQLAAGERSDERRGDFDAAFGNWASIGEAADRVKVEFQVADSRVLALAIERAATDPASLLDGRNEREALALMTCEGAELEELCHIADKLRQESVGENVTYVVNRNINFTNVCYTGCRFCAFAQRRTDTDAYSLSLDQIQDRVREAWDLGATEICMQGGIDPDLGASSYFELARAVKEAAPQIHLHAFSPMEIMNGVSKSGLTVRGFLEQLQAAGVDTIPGTAAEILDDDVRWVLTKGKLPAQQWVEVVSTAHRLGIRSSSTMMYGHVDHPIHWVRHMRVIADIQDSTSGFTEFVPLPFVHTNAPIYLAGVARRGPSVRDNRAVHAMARVMLHGRIPNIQTSWVKLGPEGVAEILRGGANDLGGTLMEETISRMAGSTFGSAVTVAQIQEIANCAGRPIRQRTTTYDDIYETPSGGQA